MEFLAERAWECPDEMAAEQQPSSGIRIFIIVGPKALPTHLCRPNLHAFSNNKGTIVSTDVALAIAAVGIKIDAVFSNGNPRPRFNFLQHVWRQFDVDIYNLTGIEAVDVAVGSANVAIQATVAALDTFDDAPAREGFEVLIDGGMADLFTFLVEPVVDIPSREMLACAPKQLKNGTSLSAQAHSQLLAALVRVL